MAFKMRRSISDSSAACARPLIAKAHPTGVLAARREHVPSYKWVMLSPATQHWKCRAARERRLSMEADVTALASFEGVQGPVLSRSMQLSLPRTERASQERSRSSSIAGDVDAEASFKGMLTRRKSLISLAPKTIRGTLEEILEMLSCGNGGRLCASPLHAVTMRNVEPHNVQSFEAQRASFEGHFDKMGLPGP